MARHEFDYTREMRVRRAAARQGYKLSKIQKRDARALGWNRWLITTADGTLVISHLVRGIETGASIDEVEQFLDSDPPDLGKRYD